MLLFLTEEPREEHKTKVRVKKGTKRTFSLYFFNILLSPLLLSYNFPPIRSFLFNYCEHFRHTAHSDCFLGNVTDRLLYSNVLVFFFTNSETGTKSGSSYVWISPKTCKQFDPLIARMATSGIERDNYSCGGVWRWWGRNVGNRYSGAQRWIIQRRGDTSTPAAACGVGCRTQRPLNGPPVCEAYISVEKTLKVSQLQFAPLALHHPILPLRLLAQHITRLQGILQAFYLYMLSPSLLMFEAMKHI